VQGVTVKNGVPYYYLKNGAEVYEYEIVKVASPEPESVVQPPAEVPEEEIPAPDEPETDPEPEPDPEPEA